MADTVTLARAIIEVGAKGVAETKAKTEALEKKLGGLYNAYKLGTISLDRYIELTGRFRAQLDRLYSGLDMAQDAIKKYGSAQAASAAMAKQAQASAKGFGGDTAMSLMLLGQALDDVQYGKGCRAAA